MKNVEEFALSRNGETNQDEISTNVNENNIKFLSKKHPTLSKLYSTSTTPYEQLESELGSWNNGHKLSAVFSLDILFCIWICSWKIVTLIYKNLYSTSWDEKLNMWSCHSHLSLCQYEQVSVHKIRGVLQSFRFLEQGSLCKVSCFFLHILIENVNNSKRLMIWAHQAKPKI